MRRENTFAGARRSGKATSKKNPNAASGTGDIDQNHYQ